MSSMMYVCIAEQQCYGKLLTTYIQMGLDKFYLDIRIQVNSFVGQKINEEILFKMQKFELLHRAAESGLLVIERDCLVFFFHGWIFFRLLSSMCLYSWEKWKARQFNCKNTGYCHQCITILSEFSIKQNLSFNFSSKPLVSES